jgi:hypothetical protein
VKAKRSEFDPETFLSIIGEGSLILSFQGLAKKPSSAYGTKGIFLEKAVS